MAWARHPHTLAVSTGTDNLGGSQPGPTPLFCNLEPTIRLEKKQESLTRH